jgi:hypothetical protein
MEMTSHKARDEHWNDYLLSDINEQIEGKQIELASLWMQRRERLAELNGKSPPKPKPKHTLTERAELKSCPSLSIRAQSVLMWATTGYGSWAESDWKTWVRNQSDSELLRIGNLGRKTLRELRDWSQATRKSS